MHLKLFSILILFIHLLSCNDSTTPFPPELVHFTPSPHNPIFKGTGSPTDWDEIIRERGYILKEDGIYHMWYTGYNNALNAQMKLGYATSPDGMTWTRYAGNPIFDSVWTEDMMVIKVGDTYQMFAEGKGDIAHRLTSQDRIHWTEQGSLNIRKVNGQSISPGPYGTPSVILEDSVYYLFYERNDSAVWLAKSIDLLTWTNVQEDPVLIKGPESYDRYGIAMNQVIRYQGKYYGYYHGTPDKDWSTWNTNVAVSEDKIHWRKYAHNPILEDNKSSGIIVQDGDQIRMYTMHPEVCVHDAIKK